MEVGKLINQLAKQLGIRAALVHQSLYIGPTQGQILDFIISEGNNREIYQKDVEKEFNLRSSSATEIINTLCDKQLIKRVSDTKDKRKKQLVFIDDGSDLASILKQQIIDTENTLLQGLSKKDTDEFIRIASIMLDNLKNK